MATNVKVVAKYFGKSPEEKQRVFKGLLQEFKKRCSDIGLMRELKKRQFYEGKSEKKRKRRKAWRIKIRKESMEEKMRTGQISSKSTSSRSKRSSKR